MAKPKSTSLEFLGCVLCTHEREAAAVAFRQKHGHKPGNADLPFIQMATAECQAWFKQPVSILDQEGAVHAIAICDRHTHERAGLLLCSHCAKEEPHPLGYTRQKKSKRKGKGASDAQASLLDAAA